MNALLTRADSVIRGDFRLARAASPGRTLAQMIVLIILFGNIYGAAMGSFGGALGERLLQIIYSAIKVPLLLLTTFLLSLPSFFIFNTLFGLRTDFAHALRSLVASQAGMTILLAALAPFTLLWNASASDHEATVLFNAVMFGVATVGGQVLLRRYYRPLLTRDPRHGMLLRIWGLVFAFVGIQMGWILRPFIGDPGKPTAFFREDTWGNAYVVIFQMIQRLFS